MIWHFDDFVIDPHARELRRGTDRIATEPQVFDLLVLLVSSSERVVSKDEIVEKVWEGRAVSDAAIASRIKSARRALGDDGRTQRYIRTVHKTGVRFVGRATPAEAAPSPSGSRVSVREPEAAQDSGAIDAASPELQRSREEPARPSIAVLPFQLSGDPGDLTMLAEALPHDLIVELARLRWLFVVARGSSFRFRSDADVTLASRMLGVRYVLGGTIEVASRRATVTVETTDTRTLEVVWADRYEGPVDAIHEVRAGIVSGVVSALEVRIPMAEAARARLASPDRLDAWAAYHLGLQHMFRFNCTDNAAATAMFERALTAEPGFARAHAGLSFTHFQDAFLSYSGARAREAAEARRHAELAATLDPLDPFANFTMGRSLWLEDDLEGSLGWLDRATTLSPNYAQGIYARAWADTICGRGEEGERNADRAMLLSPLDPLLYGMLGTRSLSHVVRGQYAAASRWAEKAARAPGAHALIAAIAAVAYELGGDHERALYWSRHAHERAPGLVAADFFRAFPFPDGDGKGRMLAALEHCGF